ncbi:MAG: type II 3-dehydroquinate dehydratase [Flavobacteriales bacterium]
MKIIIINGPNLNLLGNRENSIYGSVSFEDFFSELEHKYKNTSLTYFQSNIEGELINKLQEADTNFDAIILNAGAYTHTSIGIGDTVKAIKTPVVEVHISNIYAREDFRQQSYIASHAKGIVIGFGMQSYTLALQSFIN